MAVYSYRGKLADFGDAPFPNAVPRLWVAPMQDAFSHLGPVAAKRIPVTVASNGYFAVDLIASIDLVPPTRYTLRCEWLQSADEPDPKGWAQWDFTAQPGGGEIGTMPGTLTRVWYGTSKPPVDVPGIYWIHPTTGDVKVWS